MVSKYVFQTYEFSSMEQLVMLLAGKLHSSMVEHMLCIYKLIILSTLHFELESKGSAFLESNGIPEESLINKKDLLF